jgi:PadR family transcriptional regulator PadR
MALERSQFPSAPLEENMKKALTELLVLHLLNHREYFIGELTDTLERISGGVLKIVFPYSAVYRLQQADYVLESEKRIAPDGRKRQYYRITPLGRSYYRQLMDTYQRFIGGVNTVLNEQEA